MTTIGSIDAEARRSTLRQILHDTGSVDTEAAARRLGVHPMTIRRDLDLFEREGEARRVRGGAVSIAGQPFHDRLSENAAAKRRIAAKLVPLLPSTGAICIDASSTLHHAVIAMDPRAGDGLSIVTNGLATFDALRARPQLRSYLTGGEAEATDFALVGPVAVRMIEDFLVAETFLSTSGLDARIGTSEPSAAEAQLKRAMVRAAERVTLAVDSSKLGRRSVVRGIALGEVDRLVTELDPADDRLGPFRGLVTIV